MYTVIYNDLIYCIIIAYIIIINMAYTNYNTHT